LSDDREAVGAQGVPLTSGRSIAIDNSLHVYGTPFFIQARLPLTNEKRTASFARLMIAQGSGARGYLHWSRRSSRPTRWPRPSFRQLRDAGASRT
jgi:hypothetical protein